MREFGKANLGWDEDTAQQRVDGDWDNGLVYFRPVGDGRPLRIWERKKKETQFATHEDAAITGLKFDFQGRLGELNNME